MLYLDMDGVAADIAKALKARGVQFPCSQKPRGEMNAAELADDDLVKSLLSEPGFFEELEPMPDFHQLWDFAKPYDPAFLTARPKAEEHALRVAGEKLRWLNKTIEWDNRQNFICCLRSEKPQYFRHLPGPVQLLVDDHAGNCAAWEVAGGVAILHTSAKSTIKQAKKLLPKAA